MRAFKEVSKSEFEEYIKTYPGHLEKHVVGFCTPMLITYNDFSRGGYPEKSIVAKTWDEPEEERTYCIIDEVKDERTD